MITPARMADVTNYLFAAQALTPVEGMSAVWADYVNAEVPDMSETDLLPAARQCLKTWAAEGRSWKVDLPRFVQAVRKVRRDRLSIAVDAHGDFTVHSAVTDPGEFLRFKQVTQTAFLDGATVEQAQAAGFAALGRPVPTPELPAAGMPAVTVPTFRTVGVDK